MGEVEYVATSSPAGSAQRRLRPRGRILPWAVLSAAWLLTVMAVTPVAAWFVSGTVKASEGGADPVVAVYGVTWAFDRWADDDLGEVLRYLCPEKQKALKARLADLRRQVVNAPGNNWVKEEGFATTATGSDTATVTVNVIVNSDLKLDDGRTVTASGGFPWTFETRKYAGLEKGWKVCDFQAHEFCGEYLYC
jgi:hypothetical protein